jgi:redox-sensitive bicupin YhaK (pirin superfamily)
MSPDVETIVVPRTADLGDGFIVQRVLPSAQRRAVGPFVFFDQMAAELRAGQGLDVRPHPHIGLATVTYLFEGEILHRDSLGTVQPIRPGEVNWMTAGRGIVHSERTPADARMRESRLSGLQLWVALPKSREDTEPAFAHHDASGLPTWDEAGARVRLIVGRRAGASSPVRVHSEMLYVDIALDAGARYAIPGEPAELAAYIVDGQIRVGSDPQNYEAGRLLVFGRRRDIILSADGSARLVLIGGEPLDAPRFVWWNFVASSRQRIEQAQADWEAGRFPPVPGETEFIPLPERPFSTGR